MEKTEIEIYCIGILVLSNNVIMYHIYNIIDLRYKNVKKINK
jgi:hypothetical protein